MLTDRQLLILQAIVDDYIRSAEPVGSRSISQREDLLYSPATIRNDMAELEERGYLEKPHSSAGRVPSQKGYRYYVDHLLMPHHLTADEQLDIHSIFNEKIREIEELMQHSARVLSQLTSYISLVLEPEVFDATLKNIQIIPVHSTTAVLILVTDTGHIEKQLISIPDFLNASDLERTVNILNDRLVGIPLYLMQEKLQTEVRNVLRSHIENYEHIFQLLSTSVNLKKDEKVYYSGKTNLFMFPEFQNVESARTLLMMLEEEQTMNRILRSPDEGIQIKIGHENNLAAFEQCSLITASFSMQGRHMGTIGIIGPTRMEYHRVISVIDLLSKDLSRALSHLYMDKR